MHKELLARGIRVGKGRVQRLMQQHGIKAKTKRKFVVTIDSRHSLPVAPDLVQRIRPRPVKFSIHPAGRPINAPWLKVLRRPVESAQFDSDDFNRWCEDNQLVPSMRRRGNCWDNAVAESFFSSLKKERIKRQIYATRQDAKSDVFDYIEGFYNRVRGTVT